MNLGKDLVEVAPLLLPADLKGLSYAGFITSGNQDFYLKMILQEPNSAKGARIDVDWKLKYLLKGHESIVTKRQEQSADLTMFVLELKSILDQIVQCSPTLYHAPPSFYINIVNDMETIGWNRITHLDQHFRDIKISSRDVGDREHILSVHISDKHPYIAPVCNAAFPRPFQPHWSTSSTLVDLVVDFEEEMAIYQEFWDAIKEVDSKTRVLEPKNPSYSCVYRRIAIGTNLSVHVTFDPLRPKDLPDCKLLGPDYATSPLVQRQSAMESLWCEENSVLVNLCNTLGVTFPSPVTTEKEEYIIECGICYQEHHIDMHSLPDTNCPNEHCGRSFHHPCLYESYTVEPRYSSHTNNVTRWLDFRWLDSLSNSSKSFGMIKGECIYCSSVLSIKATSE